MTSPRISSGVSTSRSSACTPRRTSLSCMVAARARELLVRNETPRPWPRSSASTWAAPGVSTSPVQTQPSRTKTNPFISRKDRRVGLMRSGTGDSVAFGLGYYHARPPAGEGRRSPIRPHQKPSRRARFALNSKDNGKAAQLGQTDLYAPERGRGGVRADAHPPDAAVYLHALCAPQAAGDAGGDRSRAGALLRPHRGLHLHESDGPALRAPALHRGAGGVGARGPGSRVEPGDALRPRHDAGHGRATDGFARRQCVVPGLGTITARRPAAPARSTGAFDDVQKSMWQTEAKRHLGQRVLVSVKNAADPIPGNLAQIADDGLLLEQNGERVAVSYLRITNIEREGRPSA